MIISDTKVLEICKNRPNQSVVLAGVKSQNDVKKHVDGTGYKSLIKQVDGHETKKQYELRKSLSKPATIPITKVIIDELNRWTNAQGTNKTYHFDDKQLSEKFQKEVLNKVWHDSSMSHFINTDLKESLDTEFNGFFIVTKGWREIIGNITYEHRDGVMVGVNKEDPYTPYIIFVSIDDTWDFLKSGDKIEYIVYKFGARVDADGKEIEQYRFIDDKQSRIVEYDGKDWTLADRDLFAPKPNPLGYVPAVQISNTKKTVNVDGVMRSQLTFLVPMLDRYVIKDAEHTQSEILHAYPQKWMTGVKCPECDGSKMVVNDPKKFFYDGDMKTGEHMTCPVCVGEGSIVIKDSTQVAKVPQALPEGFRAYNSNVGGYITPPIDILNYQEEALEKLADKIVYAGTSNKNIVSNKFKTATENNQNLKTLEDKIDDRLRNIEHIETFLTNAIAKLHNDYKKKYQGCTIKYSRRLFYKTETEILTDIETAKRAGMPFSYIKMLQMELYKSKYIHAPLELQKAILLTELEMFVGYTYNEIKDNPFIKDEDKKYKFYFNDIIEKIEVEMGSILGKDPEMLREEIKKRIREEYPENKETKKEIEDDSSN